MGFFKFKGKQQEIIQPLPRMSTTHLAYLVRAIENGRTIQMVGRGADLDMPPRSLQDWLDVFLADRYGHGVHFRVKPEEVQKYDEPSSLYKNCSHLVQGNEDVMWVVNALRQMCLQKVRGGQCSLTFYKRYFDSAVDANIFSAIEVLKYKLPVVKGTEDFIIFKLV